MAKKSFKDFIFKFLKDEENLGAYGGVKQNPSKRFKVNLLCQTNLTTLL